MTEAMAFLAPGDPGKPALRPVSAAHRRAVGFGLMEALVALPTLPSCPSEREDGHRQQCARVLEIEFLPAPAGSSRGVTAMEQSFAAIVLVLTLASGASAAAGMDSDSEIYRWKDGSGVVHYSDTPPAGGQFTRVRANAMSVARVIDKSAAVGVGTASGSAGAGAVDHEPAEPPSQEASASARRDCSDAREQLQYVERRATEKPADDSLRAGSRQLESAYQSRLAAYNRYQTARDAQLLRVGRHCAE